MPTKFALRPLVSMGVNYIQYTKAVFSVTMKSIDKST